MCIERKEEKAMHNELFCLQLVEKMAVLDGLITDWMITSSPLQ